MYFFFLSIFYLLSLSLIFLILIQNKKGFSHIQATNYKTNLNVSTEDVMLSNITFSIAGFFLLVSCILSILKH
ncbi:Protein-export membrane protein SecG [Buchnera aphidicola (Drepanosiphum platanoidis)]